MCSTKRSGGGASGPYTKSGRFVFWNFNRRVEEARIPSGVRAWYLHIQRCQEIGEQNLVLQLYEASPRPQTAQS